MNPRTPKRNTARQRAGAANRSNGRVPQQANRAAEGSRPGHAAAPALNAGPVPSAPPPAFEPAGLSVADSPVRPIVVTAASSAPHSSDGSTMDLRLYGRVMWRFKWVMALGLIIGTVGAYMLYKGGGTYSSKAQVFITQSGFTWGSDGTTASPTGAGGIVDRRLLIVDRRLLIVDRRPELVVRNGEFKRPVALCSGGGSTTTLIARIAICAASRRLRASKHAARRISGDAEPRVGLTYGHTFGEPGRSGGIRQPGRPAGDHVLGVRPVTARGDRSRCGRHIRVRAPPDPAASCCPPSVACSRSDRPIGNPGDTLQPREQVAPHHGLSGRTPRRLRRVAGAGEHAPAEGMARAQAAAGISQAQAGARCQDADWWRFNVGQARESLGLAEPSL